jgi:hypothetical protein
LFRKVTRPVLRCRELFRLAREHLRIRFAVRLRAIPIKKTRQGDSNVRA